MILNEQGFWRILIAAGIGAATAAFVLVLDTVRRFSPTALVFGAAAAVAAYIIDWYTSDRQNE